MGKKKIISLYVYIFNPQSVKQPYFWICLEMMVLIYPEGPIWRLVQKSAFWNDNYFFFLSWKGFVWC